MCFRQTLSKNWDLCSINIDDNKSILEYLESNTQIEWYKIPRMPMQVFEILLYHNEINDDYKKGITKEISWVSDKDWIYRCHFSSTDNTLPTFLTFKGLDTIVDIYLNNRLIASSIDCYMHLETEITKYLEQNNTLILHFHSITKYIKENPLKEKYKGLMQDNIPIRKFYHDFTTYLGAKPNMLKVGVYDDIIINQANPIVCRNSDINIAYSNDSKEGFIDISANFISTQGKSNVTLIIEDPNKNIIYKKEILSNVENSIFEINEKISLNLPKLWWPRGFGEQNLYSVRVVYSNNTLINKKIGFREIIIDKDFNIKVNNKKIRIWGANLAPIDSSTACFDIERTKKLLNLAYNCNINTLRIWGEGQIYSDYLYDFADEHGILLWQDFYTGHSMYPNDKEFRTLIKKEATFIVSKLKHHPSILLWCGGNECFMSRDFSYPNQEYIGEEIFIEDYCEVCSKLDPNRYYHINSPYGGSFANDPKTLDTHSYTNTWYVPNSDFPVLPTENLRVSPPVKRSLIKYLGVNNVWPDNYIHKISHDRTYPWPETWNEVTSANSWLKIPPIENYYDPSNIDELLYSYSAAHAEYLKDTVERYRRGRPFDSKTNDHICKGHLVWKLNASHPHIYSSILDYYLEPYMPYYYLKRAYKPILISIEVSDCINIWIINDSNNDISGLLEVFLYNPRTNKFLAKTKKIASIISGKSEFILNLDCFGQFDRENIIFAIFKNSSNIEIAQNIGYVDIERHLKFPKARLTLTKDTKKENVFYIETDKFARSIELSGYSNGDSFGWQFDDNYFDLLPGQIKKIEIISKKKKGQIVAKAFYSQHQTILEL